MPRLVSLRQSSSMQLSGILTALSVELTNYRTTMSESLMKKNKKTNQNQTNKYIRNDRLYKIHIKRPSNNKMISTKLLILMKSNTIGELQIIRFNA
jgi:hypothetical protein